MVCRVLWRRKYWKHCKRKGLKMTIGMLWRDLDLTTSLSHKVQKAAAYYLKKYGRKPELCLVHPSMISSYKKDIVDGIIIRPWRPIQPGHLWIGVEEMPT